MNVSKRSLAFLYVVCILSFVAVSQTAQIDSLKISLQAAPTDQTKARDWTALSKAYLPIKPKLAQAYADSALELVQGRGWKAMEMDIWMALVPLIARRDIDSAYQISERALAYYRTEDDLRAMLKCYNFLGIIQIQQQNLTEAEKTFEEAIALAEAKDWTMNTLYLNLAIIQRRMEKFGKAITTNFKALKRAQEKDSEGVLGDIYNNIGVLYYTQQSYEEAREYYQKSLEAFEKANSPAYISRAKLNLGNAFFALEEKEKAREMYEQVLEANRELGYEKGVIAAQALMLYYHAGKNNPEARELLAHLDSLKDQMPPVDLVLLYNAKSQLYKHDAQYPQALTAVQEALEFADNHGMSTQKILALKLLSDIYELKGDYEQAYTYHLKHKALSDSLLRNSRVAELKLNEARFEFDKEQERSQLEKEALEKELKTSSLIRIFFVLALLALATIAFLIYRAAQIRKKVNLQLEMEVAQRTTDLKKANKNLEQVNYELRTFHHIASHDIKEPIRNMGNYAGIIWEEMASGDKDKLKVYFEVIEKSAAQLYTLVEDFARYSNLSQDEEIRMEWVDLNELGESLRYTLANKKGKLLIESLPQVWSSRSLLYLVLKQMIENGLRYNESATPQVILRSAEGVNQHHLIIQDNGIGIDEDQQARIFEMFHKLHPRHEHPGSGLGLSIVKRVVERLGGTVKVESQLGEGSQFVVSLPKDPGHTATS
ncbi:MAG: tetratricopeptide repeat-containing sensor histidine kinase [Bacteroidota bacterium]